MSNSATATEFHADGTRLHQWGDGNFKAVGWIERVQFVMATQVSEALFETLCGLCATAWSPFLSAPERRCAMCRFTGGTGIGEARGFAVSGVLRGVLFVPGSNTVYVAPRNVLHLIDAHGYTPPESFCEAVMRCPPMRSQAYFQALINNGGRELVRDPLPH